MSSERSRPAEVVLVQRPRALAVAELRVHPGKEARGPQGVDLVADVAAELGTVLEELPCP